MPNATKKSTLKSSKTPKKSLANMSMSVIDPQHVDPIPSTKNNKSVVSDEILKTYATKKAQYNKDI